MGDTGYYLLRKMGWDLMMMYKSPPMRESRSKPMQVGRISNSCHHKKQ